MKRNVLGLILVSVLVLAVSAWLRPSAEVQAQRTVQRNWSTVQVVTYQNGATGFFDTRTGLLVVYDTRLDKPTSIRRLTEFGKPLQKIMD